jgi:predicted Co/Zn/Cd cation transporter (cation efflux family)
MPVVLIIVGVLLLLVGGFNILSILFALVSGGAGSAYGAGYIFGRGFMAVLFILLGLKAIKSGRSRMAGSSGK